MKRRKVERTKSQKDNHVKMTTNSKGLNVGKKETREVGKTDSWKDREKRKSKSWKKNRKLERQNVEKTRSGKYKVEKTESQKVGKKERREERKMKCWGNEKSKTGKRSKKR